MFSLNVWKFLGIVSHAPLGTNLAILRSERAGEGADLLEEKLLGEIIGWATPIFLPFEVLWFLMIVDIFEADGDDKLFSFDEYDWKLLVLNGNELVWCNEGDSKFLSLDVEWVLEVAVGNVPVYKSFFYY